MLPRQCTEYFNMASIQQRGITSFFKAAGKKRKIVDSTPLITQEISEVINSSQF